MRSAARCFLKFATMALTIPASAQVLIPDTNLVERLQQLVPNAISGNLLDETHPDVLALAALPLQNSMIADFTGIEHFTGATYLNINGNGGTVLPAWPPNLERIDCNNNYFPLPPFPASLRRAGLSFSNIASLPALPAGLTWLRCTNTWLTGLPPLPEGLDTLECHYNQLTSLPALPTTLTYLSASGNELSTLPALPASLRWLSCADGVLTSIPVLPDSLEWLEVGRNLLTALPSPLPTELKDLRCYWNELASLPDLPPKLESLLCYLNNLTALPDLPITLRELNCGTNQLTALPALPDSLRELECHLNQLPQLPAFPTRLEEVNASENPLNSVPELPEGFKRLYISDTEVSCLPLLPSTMLLLQAYNTQLTCAPNRPAGSNISGLSICDVATSPCPIFHPFITGHAFYDANNDGFRDPGELPCPITIIEAAPSGDLSGCDATGYYAMPVDTGTYIVDGRPVLYHTISTAPHNVTLTGLAEVDSLNDIGYAPIPGIYDLVAHVWATAARPGFPNSIVMSVRNVGTEPTTVQMQLGADADQVIDSMSVAPTTLVGNTATWELPVLDPGTEWSGSLFVTTPDTLPLGSGLQHTLVAVPAVPDTTPADNTFHFYGMIVGSWDPNAKHVEPQTMTTDELAQDDRLRYLIEFQNTGNFPAERVVITDTLPQDLMVNTFAFIASSHVCSWYITSRVLHIIYDPIHLPDSVNNEPESHGFFAFSIRPVPGLLPGDQIINTANIYFDYNVPVITEPSVFSVELNTGNNPPITSEGLLVSPVPARDLLSFRSAVPTTPVNASVIGTDGRSTNTAILSGNTIDVRPLAPGTYLLVVTDAGGQRRSARFVKE